MTEENNPDPKKMPAMAVGIDRGFRFIEMVGITALLSVVVPAAAGAIVGLGSAASLVYLLEPVLDATVVRLAGRSAGEARIWRVVTATLLGFSGLWLLAPSVARLAQAMARVVGH